MELNLPKKALVTGAAGFLGSHLCRLRISFLRLFGLNINNLADFPARNRDSLALPFCFLRLRHRLDRLYRMRRGLDDVKPRLQMVHILLQVEQGLDEHLPVGIRHRRFVPSACGHHRQEVGILFRHIPGKRGSIHYAPFRSRGKLFRFQGRHGLRHILELADVPGPAVIDQQVYRVIGQSHLAHPVFLREIRSELPEEEIDILLAFAKGRHLDIDSVEPVIQVLAELSLAHLVEQVDIRRRNHPHVGLLDFRRSDLYEFSALEHAKELGLRGQRKLPDLIQEQRTAVSFLEISLAGLDGSGEGSLLVSEKFGIDGSLRNGSAVDCEILVALAAAVLVDDLGNILLSYAALTGNEHGQVRRCHSDRGLQRPVQGSIVSDDVIFVLQSLKFLGIHTKNSRFGKVKKIIVIFVY